MFEEGQPVDVAVLDIRMPGIDGISLARRIVAARPTTRVVILTTFDFDEHVVEALRAGADGFLTKASAIQDVVDAVRTVHRGEAMLAPTATRAVLERWVRPSAGGDSPFAAVSVREREVAGLVAAGLSNEEIAERLHLSLATVKTYLSRLFTRLGVRDRTQLVILAYESGFLTPGSSTFG